MQLINNIENIKEQFINPVITIGNFDGVHVGHQALLHEVIKKADSIHGSSVVLTFKPHPMRVLKKNNHFPLITLCEQKVELIEAIGIDFLLCLPFTLEFASLPAVNFIEDILVGSIGMKAIVTGKDYTFGKNRQGNIELLNQYAPLHGFEVIVKNWIEATVNSPYRISSTRIRRLVKDGDLENAQKLLGRHYQIRGMVKRGRDRGGRLLGFPTANIELKDELSPKRGVYAVTVEYGGDLLKGVANIGYSPTFDDHIFTVEVHVLNFNGDMYDQPVKVNFVKRIRDEKKFSSVNELAQQIGRDVKKADALLTGSHLKT